jgi:uncharacterized protein (DUF924 family)
MLEAETVLQFWFVDHGPSDWFAGTKAFDEAIAANFGELHSQVARGEAFGWRDSAEGRLAEVIVLDQFSRQLFRGNARAFASDTMALALAQEAVRAGADLALDAVRRPFFYLPFMHSESLLIHDEAVRLYTALGDANLLGYEQKHREVVERYGRFPFRNAVLGRESSPAELEHLELFAKRGF